MRPAPSVRCRSSVPANTGTSMLTAGIRSKPSGSACGVSLARCASYSAMRFADQSLVSGAGRSSSQPRAGVSGSVLSGAATSAAIASLPGGESAEAAGPAMKEARKRACRWNRETSGQDRRNYHSFPCSCPFSSCVRRCRRPRIGRIGRCPERRAQADHNPLARRRVHVAVPLFCSPRYRWLDVSRQGGLNCGDSKPGSAS